MEGIIFIGVQASGKSSFYQAHFFDSHVRISLDLLRTRNKEARLLDLCLELHQRVVIDNTNPTRTDRARYIERFRSQKYRVIGYYFQSALQPALARNASRAGKKRIPDVGLLATHKKLELPTYEEGFDELHYVRLANATFEVTPWQDEI